MANSVSLEPLYGTEVSDEYPDDVMPIQTYIIVGGSRPSTGTASINRGWFMFDLSSIPATATIKSASLGLYHFFNNYNYVDLDFYVRRATDISWDASTLTYNNAPNGSVVSDIIGTFNPSSGFGGINISLTVAPVQAALSTGKISLQVRSSNEASTTYMLFYHESFGLPELNSLTVTYYTGTELHGGEFAQMEIH